MAAIGEDSSGQEMKKKTCGVGKDRRRRGREAPCGLEPRVTGFRVRVVLTVTPRDQLMEVTGRVT